MAGSLRPVSASPKWDCIDARQRKRATEGIRWPASPVLRSQSDPQVAAKAATLADSVCETPLRRTQRQSKWDSNSRSPQEAEPSVGTSTGRPPVPVRLVGLHGANTCSCNDLLDA